MGFGQKEITQEIQRYEEAVQSYQDNITIFEKKKMENEDTITSLRHLKAELEGEIIKGEKSLNLDAHDLGSSSSKRKELEEQSASLDKAIDDAISSVSEQNRGLASLKIEKQNLRSAITQLNNPALIAELNAFEQKHREISDETIRMTSELKNAQRLLKDITQPEFDKISSILKQIEKEEQQFTQEGQGIEGRRW